jgi:hypothetical protein
MTRTRIRRDTIVEEIHRTRQRIAEQFGGDIVAILEDARNRQAASGRPVWQGPSSNEAARAHGRTGESSTNETSEAAG